MARGDFAGVDLFGDPLPVSRDGPGRPEHEWTKENSDKINLLFATGHEVKDAARVIGISVPTLRKHYFSEVEQWRVARLRLKASLLAQLHAEGEKGNVAAIKELFKQAEKGALVQLAAKVANRPEPAKRPAPPLGKKEQQKAAAGKVKGVFEPPPAPMFN